MEITWYRHFYIKSTTLVGRIFRELLGMTANLRARRIWGATRQSSREEADQAGGQSGAHQAKVPQQIKHQHQCATGDGSTEAK